MIQFLHQRQQTTDFAGWKTDAGKPVKVTGQIGNQAAFVLAVGRHERNQAL